MKCFATFGRVGDEFELIAGPNGDYESQANILKDATVSGSDYEAIHLVDIGKGTVKRRKPPKSEPKPATAKRAKKSEPES